MRRRGEEFIICPVSVRQFAQKQPEWNWHGGPKVTVALGRNFTRRKCDGFKLVRNPWCYFLTCALFPFFLPSWCNWSCSIFHRLLHSWCNSRSPEALICFTEKRAAKTKTVSTMFFQHCTEPCLHYMSAYSVPWVIVCRIKLFQLAWAHWKVDHLK